MKSARFLQLISNKDVFTYPEEFIKILKETPTKNLRCDCYVSCAECWLQIGIIKHKIPINMHCEKLCNYKAFQNIGGNVNLLIEMKRFVYELDEEC